MKDLARKGPVGRDWFGLDHFVPGPRFLRDGSVLHLLEEVGSTNDFLLGRGPSAPGRRCTWDGWGWRAESRATLAPVSDPVPGTVVVARRQTRGRGRQGRAWTDCGGLNLTVVVPPHRASFDRGFSVWIGLLTVLLLREKLNLDARLKWPNDIVVNGRKLGGILVESTGHRSHPAVAAGLGLNLSTGPGEFPAQLQGVATSVFAETGRRVRPADVAGPLLARVEAELDRFDMMGWEPWKAELACLDCLLGRTIVLQRGPRRVEGQAAGIDETGSLVVVEENGDRRTYAAGDVHIVSDARAHRDDGEDPDGGRA